MVRSVKRSEWSYQISGIVNTSPEAVMAWWFHPDRAKDFLAFAEKIGAIDAAFSELIEDGVRVRTYLWKDRRGWSYRHRHETHLSQDGMAPRIDDHFIATGSGVVGYKSPTGAETTMTCFERTAFSPLAAGGTKVRAVHEHSLAGGAWLRRIKMERPDRANTQAAFRDWIDRCSKTEGSTSDALSQD
jgi:hypothetical protein